MHEYSLAVAIIDQVKDIVKQHKANRVNKITLSAGPYEMVIPELLYEAYDIIIDELDKFRDSKLELIMKPAEITCLNCDYKGEPSKEKDEEFAFNFKCPKCDSRDTHLNMQYLTIETVDLELPE
jgi:hydrogenase nickel insertion protein HypA